MAKQMSPELAAELAAFQQKHPDFDLSTNFNTFLPALRSRDPQAVQDFLTLRQHLDNEDFHLTGSGDTSHDQAVWKQALEAAAVVGAPIAAAGLAGAVGGGAAAGGSVASPVVAAAGGGAGGIFKSILGPVIGAGAGLTSTYLQGKAYNDAAKLQQESSTQQLALQKEMFERELQEQRRREDLQRADFGPYGSLGRGAVSQLATGTGIDLGAFPMPTGQPMNTSAPTSLSGFGQQSPQAAPQATPSALGAGSAAPTGSPNVTQMRAPDGRTLYVPPEKVAELSQLGAVRI